ncbi:MAG: HDOD domain-containing protein, partial [Aliarcobacter sp.]|nr:HDOD domain-containing protein [Aliarcobacter sp.]
LINMIEYVDDISKVNNEYKIKTQILDVIKTACPINSTLSDKSVEKALIKASKYGLDIKILKKSIETLQDRLLDE